MYRESDGKVLQKGIIILLKLNFFLGYANEQEENINKDHSSLCTVNISTMLLFIQKESKAHTAKYVKITKLWCLLNH